GIVLHARGRDIEDSESALQFDKETCRWTILGAAAEVRRSHERSRVIAALQDEGAPLKVDDIKIRADLRTRNAADLLLGKMAKDGEVVRVKRGWYDLPGKGGQIGQKEGSGIEGADFIGQNSNLS